MTLTLKQEKLMEEFFELSRKHVKLQSQIDAVFNAQNEFNSECEEYAILECMIEELKEDIVKLIKDELPAICKKIQTEFK